MSAVGGDESVEEYEEVDALEDSDDDFAYEEVDIEDIEDDDLLAGDDEDLETALRSRQGLGVPLVGANTTMKPEPNAGEVTKRPEVRAGARDERHHPPVSQFGPRVSFSRADALTRPRTSSDRGHRAERP